MSLCRLCGKPEHGSLACATAPSAPVPCARNDGGPAFPVPPENLQAMHATGMTLRDYFAAKALSSPIMERAMAGTPRPEGRTVAEHAALIAYAIAERMLTERTRK